MPPVNPAATRVSIAKIVRPLLWAKVQGWRLNCCGNGTGAGAPPMLPLSNTATQVTRWFATAPGSIGCGFGAF